MRAFLLDYLTVYGPALAALGVGLTLAVMVAQSPSVQIRARVLLDLIRRRRPTPPRAPITSVRNGRWDDPATWDKRRVPGVDDCVVIAHEVTFDVGPGPRPGRLPIPKADPNSHSRMERP